MKAKKNQYWAKDDLYNALPCLRHSNRCTPGHKHRLAATHIGEDSVEVTFHEDHLKKHSLRI